MRAYIGLGSNLGDRLAMLRQAISEMERFATVCKRSSVYETEPAGGPQQPDYLNAAVLIDTDLLPARLMEKLLQIEAALGRNREAGQRNLPRPIDLDVLLLGERAEVVLDEPSLVVPHPRLHQRTFVLRPLLDLDASLVHPTLGVPLKQLYDELLTTQGQPSLYWLPLLPGEG